MVPFEVGMRRCVRCGFWRLLERFTGQDLLRCHDCDAEVELDDDLRRPLPRQRELENDRELVF